MHVFSIVCTTVLEGIGQRADTMITNMDKSTQYVQVEL